jgi:hypothetical protein
MPDQPILNATRGKIGGQVDRKERKMQKMNQPVLLLVILLSLTTLACSFSVDLPWDIGAPDVAISQEQVSGAATRTAIAAATAAALAGQAGQIAATAVVQGDNLVATAVAESAPNMPDSLEAKLAAIRPDADGNYVVSITDEDLAQFFAAQGGSFSSGDASIENLRINTLPDAVVLNGDLTSPVALSLTARFRPVVEDGRLRLQAVDASAGIFPVPSSMLSLIETGVNVGLGQALDALPAGVRIQDVQLGDGAITLFAR